jgi:hypothetical protein
VEVRIAALPAAGSHGRLGSITGNAFRMRRKTVQTLFCGLPEGNADLKGAVRSTAAEHSRNSRPCSSLQ